MSYMVLYTGRDGRSAFGRCEDVAEAAAEVERLRNNEDIDDAKIFRLEEVRFEIKPYFRVELPGLNDAPPAPALVTPADATTEETSWAPTAASTIDAPAMVAPPPPPHAPVAPMAYDGGMASDDDAIVGSRRGLFGR